MALLCGFSFGSALVGMPSAALAQESLAGVGAATAIGSTLGATAGSGLSAGRIAGGAGGEFGEDEAGAAGGGAGAGAPVRVAPFVQNRTVSGQEIVRQLRATARPTTRTTPTRTTPSRPAPRSPATTARQAARVAAQPAAQRSRAIAQRYQVPPVDWRAAYLPQDRYKLGKVWRVVSTEDSRFYYRPEDLARRQFNRNRVIGFASWQDAMAAGYRPDPISRPEPAGQIVTLSGLTRGENFFRFVEYVYAGQVSPVIFDQTFAYARRVADAILAQPQARPYLSPTLDRVFLASITGDRSVIPRTVGGSPGRVEPAAGTPNFGAMAPGPALPGARPGIGAG